MGLFLNLFFGVFWCPFGSPWEALGVPLGRPGLPWETLAAPWVHLGLPWKPLGAPMVRPWLPWAAFAWFCLFLLGFCSFLLALASSWLLLAASGCSRLASSCFWLPLTASGCSWVDRHIQRQKHTDRHRETPDSQEYRRTLQTFPVLANTGIFSSCLV